MPESFHLGEFIVWYAVFIVSLVFHEAAHALAAWRGGDDTAYRGGQVTLDPWPHIRREPLGTVVIPILSYFIQGWMLGWASAPFDPAWGRRHPRRMALMAAAGPAANLLLAVAAFLVMKGLIAGDVLEPSILAGFEKVVEPAARWQEAWWARLLSLALSVALNLNLLLCIFNLVPLPPLDGGSILVGLLPPQVGARLDEAFRSPWMPLIGIIIAMRFFPEVFRPVMRTVLDLL